MGDQDTKNKNTRDTVQVAVRIRPMLQSEVKRGCEECVDVVTGEQQIQIKNLSFTYNYVFPQHITQQEFYDTTVRGLIGKLFQGYNVTVLAYGQTGSGKTYTMGTNYSGSTGDSTKLGVIPQAAADIFDYVEAHEDKFTFKVSVSFMELYQEQCYDLLSGKERAHSIIDIREDVNKSVVLPGLTLLPVASTRDTMMVLERGSAGRVTGATAMNEGSSRSHAVFTIVINKESRIDKNLATTSKFHLVDLAGSERIKKTLASGERLREGVKINQGLLALGNVISALGEDGSNRSYICYRDSKLTRLLQDSLGGNSLTLMVACVSPADYNLDETVSTLRYADRARRIRNKPIINQDAKAAEIARLNNLVNELRLQLVGSNVNTPRDETIEDLRDELEKKQIKYNELLQKHKLVCDQLGNMLIQNSNHCDKALLAETAREKMERKLNAMKEQCDLTVDNLTENKEETDKTHIIEYFKDIKSQLEELHSVNLKTDTDMIDQDMDMLTHSIADRHDNELPMSEDVAVMEQEKRAMGQYYLNQELQELNRAMAIKASVVQTILDNNKDMIENQTAMKENEDQIAMLEKQRDELLQLVNKSKSKDTSVEERRNKVTLLEQEISELKKKCQTQANIIRSKEKDEAKINSLNKELQAMKATKVKIIKQMRVESEKFRKWKMDNERAMLRLKNEDKKRTTAMAKMESLHAKQQSVLKRKMEEAVAVNKRLKEALDKQKHYQVKHNAKGNLKQSAVQQYIEDELDLHLSIFEAEKSLEELMEYRALITAQIETLRGTEDSTFKDQKMSELEQDLAQRKAQISDLQQKIIIADQETKSRTQWDNIQSMLEAKVALKCTFDLLVDAKRELSNTSEKGYQTRYEELKEAYDHLAITFENSKAEFEHQLATVRMQSEEKLSALVSLQRSLMGDRTEEACMHLRNVIKYQQEKLEQLDDENKILSAELEELRVNACVRKKQAKASKKQQRFGDGSPKVEYVDLTDDEEDFDEDCDDKDPDWRATPMMKRIHAQRSRLTMNFNQTQPDFDCPNKATTSSQSNDSSSSNTSRVVKRSSDGSSHCTCRGSCSTKICGCVKTNKGCAESCKCQRELCKNRRNDIGDNENIVVPSQDHLNPTTSHYCDEKFNYNGSINGHKLRELKDEFLQPSNVRSLENSPLRSKTFFIDDRSVRMKDKSAQSGQFSSTYIKRKKSYFFSSTTSANPPAGENED